MVKEGVVDAGDGNLGHPKARGAVPARAHTYDMLHVVKATRVVLWVGGVGK